MFNKCLEDILAISSKASPIRVVRQHKSSHMPLNNLAMQLKHILNFVVRLQENFSQSNFSDLIQEQKNIYLQQIKKRIKLLKD